MAVLKGPLGRPERAAESRSGIPESFPAEGLNGPLGLMSALGGKLPLAKAIERERKRT